VNDFLSYLRERHLRRIATPETARAGPPARRRARRSRRSVDDREDGSERRTDRSIASVVDRVVGGPAGHKVSLAIERTVVAAFACHR
jgi:hypothetical protein